MRYVKRKIKTYLIIAFVALIGMAITEQVMLYFGFSYRSSELVFTQEEKDYIDNSVISWAAERDYYPYIGINSTNQVEGISADYIRLISEKSGLVFSVHRVCDFMVCIQNLKDEKVDLITSLKPTLERSKYFSFTRPYAYADTYRITRRGVPIMSVAVGNGYAITSFVRETMYDLIIVETLSDEESVKMFINGEVDSVVLDERTFRRAANMYNLSFADAEKLSFEYIYSFAISPKDRILLSILNKTLSNISAQEHEEIRQRWN